MSKSLKAKLGSLLVLVAMVLGFTGNEDLADLVTGFISSNTGVSTSSTVNVDSNATVEKDGWYSSPEEVAAYLHQYNELPDNFLTKNEAEKRGWSSSKGNLWDVADGMSIGGDHFGNYEGNLPDDKGIRWTECDVNYKGGYRGSERILFSNTGLIYYTNDHYETFKQLY